MSLEELREELVKLTLERKRIGNLTFSNERTPQYVKISLQEMDLEQKIPGFLIVWVSVNQRYGIMPDSNYEKKPEEE